MAEGDQYYSVSFPQATTPGNRLIVAVVSLFGAGEPGEEAATHTPYTKVAEDFGYCQVAIWTKIATGHERYAGFHTSSTDGAMILYAEERDDCPDLLYATDGYSSDGSVTCSAVTVPAMQGYVIAAEGRIPPGSSGSSWSPSGLTAAASSGGYSTTLVKAQFYAGRLPAAGRVTYKTTSTGGSYPTGIALAGFGRLDPNPPTMPPGLHATDVTDTTASVAWDPASDDVGVTAYGLYRNGSKVGADQTGRTYTFTGLTKGQTYELGVDARDATGNRSEKSTITVLAVTDLAPPTAPGSLRLTDLAHTTATLAWDGATDDVGLAGYGIYLDDSKVGDDQTELSHTFQGLGRGRAYTAGVDAVDTSGNRSPIAEIGFTTLADTLPGAPPGVTATPGVEEVTLAWQPASDDLGIARYEVLLDGLVTGATSTLGYVIEGLNPDSTYTVGVRAVDDGGGRGPIVELEVSTLPASWTPIASPLYRLEGWTGNARDAYGVDWVVEREQGWGSTGQVAPLESESDSAAGGFSGPGSFGPRLIVLSGKAVARSRTQMLAAQERIAAALYPDQLGTLRVQEGSLTRQARVRVTDEVEITDRGSFAFGWVLTLTAPNPRRTAVRPIYDEVMVETLPGSASASIHMAGDYQWIPAVIRVWGPIKDFTITHQESGLVIRSKAGTILPADARYSLELDLATRVVLAYVPPDVHPEPRPGRGVLGSFPARFAPQNGPNTITLSGDPVPGEVGSPRMVIQAWDSWR
ncbi:fibronectin type III domain-containing protein [Nonomuraea candida]|uniref:fibronectin type III domain-containing protein n=1 Tax=Nonomuraea candida TaxID=359159 RepID=UPI0005BB6211|nr:fibronectin type III domain-containing protein [Nonomuraea candida]